MIPPLQAVRQRSIQRWMREHDPHAAGLTTAMLNERANALDEQMLDAFECAEDELMAQMMRDGTWGTEPGMRLLPTKRMEIWQDVVSTALPTSDLCLED